MDLIAKVVDHFTEIVDLFPRGWFFRTPPTPPPPPPPPPLATGLLSVFPLADQSGHCWSKKVMGNDYTHTVNYCDYLYSACMVLSCWTDWSGNMYNTLRYLGMVETIAGSFLATHPKKGGNIECPSYCK